MKKTILATAIPALLLAGSAFAGGVDLIKNDDMVLNLNGDIDLIIKNMDDKEGTQIETNLDDLDFRFKYFINDNVTFIAGADWTAEFSQGDGIYNAYAWAGAEIGNLTVTAGTQTTSFDPFSVEKFEIMNMGRASGDQDGSTAEFDQTIVATYETKSYSISGTYVLPEDDDDETTNLKSSSALTNPERYELVASAKLGSVSVMAGVGHEENYEGGTEYDSDFYQAQAKYKMGNWEFGALYAAKSNDYNGNEAESDGFELNAVYKVNSALTVHAGYEMIDTDIDGADAYKGAAIGAIYKFSPVVQMHFELGQEDGTYLNGVKNTGSTKDDLNQAAILLNLDF
jgi:hypothetical protein